jgi:hypothetical protein
MIFDENYFSKQKFSGADIENYKASAKRDFEIAVKSKELEVKFHFSYMALIKIGLCSIAREGYRVKSRPGHHIKIIEALSKLMKNDDIIVIGDKMRKDRNIDFYEPAGTISNDDVAIFTGLIKDLITKL